MEKALVLPSQNQIPYSLPYTIKQDFLLSFVRIPDAALKLFAKFVFLSAIRSLSYWTKGKTWLFKVSE